MNVEIEYKFALKTSVVEFIQLLSEKGYSVGKRNYEKTVMFDNPTQIMQITDGRIRLRQSGDEYSLSYKKPLPKIENEPKREIEYETTVGDFAIIESILNTMEFTPSSSYEKYRTKAKDDGVQITIDEYPYQTFVEIEGDEEKIKKVAQNLGFNTFEHINLPADTLFNIWRKEKGLPESIHMKFDDFDK